MADAPPLQESSPAAPSAAVHAPEGVAQTAQPSADLTAMASSSKGKASQRGDNMPTPGSGMAFFSTDLGNHPTRQLSDTPYPPVVVRSGDQVEAIVSTARYWKKKYRRECMCIFLNSGWQPEDLWDAEDIHVEGVAHLSEVIRFLAQENVHHAYKYAETWSKAYPDRVLDILATPDAMKMYDHGNHLEIVDKLFVRREQKQAPDQFLWHVANIMRVEWAKEELWKTHNMIIQACEQQNQSLQPAPQASGSDIASSSGVKKGEASSVATGSSSKTKKSESSSSGPSGGVKKGEAFSKSAKKGDASSSGTTSSSGFKKADKRKKKPSKQSKSEENQDNKKSPSMPTEQKNSQPSSSSQVEVLKPAERSTPVRPLDEAGQSHDQTAELRTHKNDTRAPEASVPDATRKDAVQAPKAPVPEKTHISNPKIRSQSVGSMPVPTPYMHSPSTKSRVPHAENIPHGPSTGFSARTPSGTHATMAPFQHGPVPPMHPQRNSSFMSPPAHALQPFQPGMGQPGMIHHPGVPASGLHPQYYYAPQHPQMAVPRAMAFEEMPYGSYNMSRHAPEPWQAGGGRGNYHGNSAFHPDPNAGFNSAFRDPYSGRRSGRNSQSDHFGRPRQASGPKQYTGFHADTHADTGESSSHALRRPSFKHLEDPLITRDLIGGCHDRWIGPDNKTVKELYLGHLPHDVEPHEIMTAVKAMTRIQPAGIARLQYNARVKFSSVSDARIVLEIFNKSPLVLHGEKVQVLVPYHYYRKPYNPGAEHDTRGTNQPFLQEKAQVTPDTTKKGKQPVYSPQDARSSLHNKYSQPSTSTTDLGSSGSPQLLTSKEHAGTSIEDIEEKPGHRATTGEAHTAARNNASLSNDNASTEDSIEFKEDGHERERQDSAQTDITTIQKFAKPVPGKSEEITSSETVVEPPSTPVTTQPATIQGSAKSQEEPTISTEAQPVHVHTKVELDASNSKENHPVVKLPNDSVEPTTSNTMVKVKDDDIAEADAETAVVFTSKQIIQKVAQAQVNTGGHSIDAAAFADSHSPGVASSSTLEPTEKAVQEPVPLSSSSKTDQPTKSKLSDERTKSLQSDTPQNVELPATSPKQAFVDATKKSGPQHTASLNPFAKASKAQRQKEKDQKKREKKKEQEEKAARAKATKLGSTSPTASPSDQAAHLESKASPDPHGAAAKSDLVTTDQVTESSGRSEKSKKKKNKSKGKAFSADMGNPQEEEQTQDEDTGKQNGGIITASLNKTTSVTENVKEKAYQSQTEQVSSVGSAVSAQSPNPGGSSVIEIPIAAQPLDSQTKAADTPARLKSKRPVPAVPNITLRPHSSSVRSKASQCPIALTGEDSSPAKPHKTRTSSRSSSATLHDDTISVQSPIAENYFTPAQTPGVLSASNMAADQAAGPPANVPKNKKKKSKKKKNKSAAVAHAESSAAAEGPSSAQPTESTSELDAQPFDGQFTHIDQIRAATKDKGKGKYIPDTDKRVANQQAEKAAAKSSKNQAHAEKNAESPTQTGRLRDIDREGLWPEEEPWIKEAWANIKAFMDENKVVLSEEKE